MRQKIKKQLIYLIVSVGFLFNVTAAAQSHLNSISGRVIGGENGQGLVAVNVYLSNTTIGDVTNKDGRYLIKDIPPGNYSLIFHFVGFEKVERNIDIGKSDTLIQDAILKPTQYELDSLQVISQRDRRWERYLRRFENNFIGTSQNAENTRILNPEVLDFEREMWGVYSASAREELHVINEALGYESFVDLDVFTWNYFNDTGQALYYVRMKEMDHENNSELNTWRTKRDVTYRSSIRYFFKSLLNMAEKPPKEGIDYRNGRLSISTVVGQQKKKTFLEGGFIQKLNDESKYKKFIPNDEQFEVSGFKFKLDSKKNKLGVIPENSEVSYLGYSVPEAEEYIFVLDQNGNLLNPLDIVISGYWGNFRFGDFLPLNYNPDHE